MKKTIQKPANESGISMKEVLFGLALILIIVFFIGKGALPSLRVASKESYAVDEALGIQKAIEAFYLEWKRFPPSQKKGREGVARSNPAFMNHLTGEDISLNKSGTVYFQGEEATDGAGGFVPSTGGKAYRDPWGQDYWIVLDLDGDKKIHDPFIKKKVKGRAVVYSAGEDYQIESVEDNLGSRD